MFMKAAVQECSAVPTISAPCAPYKEYSYQQIQQKKLCERVVPRRAMGAFAVRVDGNASSTYGVGIGLLHCTFFVCKPASLKSLSITSRRIRLHL